MASVIVLALVAVAFTACHKSPFEVDVAGAGTSTIAVGEELQVSAVGYGNYTTPPAMAGTAIAFLDMDASCHGVCGPGFVAQRYRFRGVQAGQTIVQFSGGLNRSGGVGGDFADTVIVR
jgi:hypothetical protein